MLERIAQSLVLGDPVAWAIVLAIWSFALVFIWLCRKDGSSKPRLLFALLFASALTSIAGAFIATAVSIPHLRWSRRPAKDLVVPTGETWRKLRGPWTIVDGAGGPDIAIPTIDSQDRWILYGLFSEGALAGFEEAGEGAPGPGQVRMCEAEGQMCRAWPASWPAPVQSQGSLEFVLSPNGVLYAAAFERESKKFLIGAVSNTVETETPNIKSAEDLAQISALELLGRIGTPPPKQALTSLFIARRVLNGHFEQVRVVAAGKADNTFVFSLERARANLWIGLQFMRYAGRPGMLLCSLILPIMLLILLFCPALLMRHLGKKGAVKHELPSALIVELLPRSPESAGALTPARICETVKLGEKTLKAGDIVAVLMDAERERERIASLCWYEIPGMLSVHYTTGDIVQRSAGVGAKGEPGVLVAADRGLLRRAAFAWVRRPVYVAALLSLGISALVPGVGALIGLFAGW